MKKLLLSTVLVSCLFYNAANATELTKALAENKPLSEIQDIIKKGASVNQPDEENGLYPLMLVKDDETFNFLISIGADISAITDTPEIQTSVLLNACENGTLKMVQKLIERGLDANQVIGEDPISTPLISSLSNKDENITKYLIQSGAKVDTVLDANETAIQDAIALNKSPDLIKYLIDHGADIHWKTDDGLLEENLHFLTAANALNPEIFEVLKTAGLEMKSEDLNPLLAKAIEFNESLDIVKYLIQNGANPNVQAKKLFRGRYTNKEYPIILAVRYGTFDVFKFLLSQGVNISVKDMDGKGVLELYEQNEKFKKNSEYDKILSILK